MKNKTLRYVVLLVAGLFVVMWGVTSMATALDSSKEAMPKVERVGVDYAVNEWLKDFSDVSVHDAAARGRSVNRGDYQDWIVCFQSPAPDTKQAHNGKIRLAAVPNDEECPYTDLQMKRAGQRFPMPDIWSKTPLAVRQIMGDHASVTFYDYRTGSEVDDKSGNHRVCTQQLSPGHDFYGQPVAFTVAPFKDLLNRPLDLPTVCPKNAAWRGVVGRSGDAWLGQ